MRDIRQFCDAHYDWLMETIVALVAAESPTTDRDAANRCGDLISALVRQQGGEVELVRSQGCGDHLVAGFGGGSGDRMLLLGHFDTVWPVGQLKRMPIREVEGRLHGPGVYDMKGGIGIGLLALRALAATGRLAERRVTMLLTADEERGSATSRTLVEDQARPCGAVLVLEPGLPGGAVKTGRKGCGEFELRIQGVAAHAGIDPSRGASAIDELAAQIGAIGALRSPERGVTLNVGIVEGGSRPNVVADSARAVVDVRAGTMADAHRIEEAMQGLRPTIEGAALEVTGGFNRPPFERTPAVARLYVTARAIAAELGRELGEGTTGGGSDGNFTGALGVPTLDGLGAVGDGAHALDEHLLTAELTWRAALVAGLIDRLGTCGDAPSGVGSGESA
ncbi:MAG: M20 family metallopeptidase [Acidobacteria bacterium]|nr:M20 family metallopeptidase [Acidobacteriota bacterium]MYJ02920.1 M20 family metallopeptidase [Acidobacteriota bacterium]